MAKKISEVAMNIEMVIQNQLKISGTTVHSTTNEITTTSVNNIHEFWNRSRPPMNQIVKPTICPNCGYGWSTAHRQNCPGLWRNCKNCAIANHFAKVCRKPKNSYKPKPRLNNMDDSISEAATVDTSATVGEQVNHIDRLFQKQSISDANYDLDYDDYNDNCVAKISINNDTREAEPMNLDICIGNTKTKALLDSGSACTIINKNLANAAESECKGSFCVHSPEMQDLKTFSNDLFKIIGVIKTSIKCNDWVATGVIVTVVEDGHRPIIGRDLFQKLGFSLTQTKQVANFDQNQCLIKKQIALDSPGLISRIGKSLKNSVKSTFHKHFTPTHQKGRRIPINLQPLVNTMGQKQIGIPTFNTNQTKPRAEKSLDIKLARKVSERSKRDLRGLWETLAPGSTVIRTSPTTTVIKEPGVPKVRVRNSDVAKFGTRAERNTDLWQYAQRRPLPYEKTTEEKLAQHTKDLKKKYRGD